MHQVRGLLVQLTVLFLWEWLWRSTPEDIYSEWESRHPEVQKELVNLSGPCLHPGPVEDWWWIPGELNIADIIRRGSTPEDLQEGSEWQNGTEFLKWPVKEWPKKPAREVEAGAKGGIDKLQRKAFLAALTRAQIKDGEQNTAKQQERRFSLAWEWRAAKKWKMISATCRAKWEASPSVEEAKFKARQAVLYVE